MSLSDAAPWEGRLGAALARLSRGQVWALCLLCTAAVVTGDVLTGADVAFTGLYLLPLGVGGWLGGRWLAQLVAVVATLSGLLVDLTAHLGRAPALHVWNFATHAGVFFAFAAAVPRLSEAAQREARARRRDALTGLAGRAGFFELADREVLRARRTGHPLSVLYLDLDGLGALNRRLGREAGDRALAAVGAVLREELRSIDVAGRLGSDELAVVLPETTPADAQAVVARLQAQVAARGQALELPLSVSVGAASYIGPQVSAEVMVAAADARRYLDKHGRRGPAGLAVLPAADARRSR